MWNLQNNMKAIIFYFTVILSMTLLCMEFSLTWAALAVVDAVLFEWCYSHISPKDMTRYSGYSTWYKFLKD